MDVPYGHEAEEWAKLRSEQRRQLELIPTWLVELVIPNLPTLGVGPENAPTLEWALRQRATQTIDEHLSEWFSKTYKEKAQQLWELVVKKHPVDLELPDYGDRPQDIGLFADEPLSHSLDKPQGLSEHDLRAVGHAFSQSSPYFPKLEGRDSEVLALLRVAALLLWADQLADDDYKDKRVGTE